MRKTAKKQVDKIYEDNAGVYSILMGVGMLLGVAFLWALYYGLI